MRFLAPVLVLLLAPVARAELAPQVARTLAICATPGQEFAAMATDLGRIGWLKLPPRDLDRVGRALAPAEMVFYRAWGLLGDWDPVAMEDRLAETGALVGARAARDLPGLVTLVRSTGEVLQFGGRMGPTVDRCLMTLPGATAEEVAAVLGIAFRDISRPPLRLLTTNGAGVPSPMMVDWLSFEAGAFPTAQPDPILSILHLAGGSG